MTYKYILHKRGHGPWAEYNSLEELARDFMYKVKGYGRSVEFKLAYTDPVRIPHDGWMYFPRNINEFVLEDPYGRKVHPDLIYRKIDEAWDKRPRAKWYRALYPDHKFRDGPVPRTGNSGGRFRCLYQQPATHNERKQTDLREDNLYLMDYGKQVKVRASRSAMNLPNNWDDYLRSDWGKKNWKGQRRTQYKG